MHAVFDLTYRLTTTVENADAHGEIQNICRPMRNSSGPKYGNSIDQLLFNLAFPEFNSNEETS